MAQQEGIPVCLYWPSSLRHPVEQLSVCMHDRGGRMEYAVLVGDEASSDHLPFVSWAAADEHPQSTTLWASKLQNQCKSKAPVSRPILLLGGCAELELSSGRIACVPRWIWGPEGLRRPAQIVVFDPEAWRPFSAGSSTGGSGMDSIFQPRMPVLTASPGPQPDSMALGITSRSATGG